MPDNEFGTTDYKDEDDKKLEAMGYVPSFKREFSNLATVCAPHSILSLFLIMCIVPSDQLCLQHPGTYYVSRRTQSQRTDLGRKGLCSSVAMTFNTPLLLGGPSSVRQHNIPHITAYDSNRMFSTGNVVLDPWIDHEFHVR
jgi:hypothetical protein